MTLRANAIQTLTEFIPPNAIQAQLRDRYLEHISTFADAFNKSCPPAHITVSALLFSADLTKVALTLHPKVGRWLQLGGHCEPDDSTLQSAAHRECAEESGLVDLEFVSQSPIQLDAHTINCRGDGLVTHLDVQFALKLDAATPSNLIISNESLDLKWFAIDAIPQGCDQALHSLIAAAQKSF